MQAMKFFNYILLCMMLCTACAPSSTSQKTMKENPYYNRNSTEKLNVNNEEWKKILDPQVYAIAREQATERPFTGKFNDFAEVGKYYCAVCGNHLFDSDAKFASTCGWPSFFQAAQKDAMIYKDDFTHGMYRIEVKCGKCNSHLGHIFDDGPAPTAKRYCMNSAVLDFEPDSK